jgi:heme-degrading monooxygenase HmoA
MSEESQIYPLARVSRTPAPPYYAVTTTAELSPAFDRAEHMRLGAELYVHAREIGGFLGLEAFYEGNASIAVSYWTDLEAIGRWRRHPAHERAKALAKGGWFGPTITRIARVEAAYGFHLPVWRAVR